MTLWLLLWFHKCLELLSGEVYTIQHYVIKFVSDVSLNNIYFMKFQHTIIPIYIIKQCSIVYTSPERSSKHL
jgi:hypothetical protein